MSGTSLVPRCQFPSGIPAPLRGGTRQDLAHLPIRAVLVRLLDVLSPWCGVLGSLPYLQYI